MVEVNQFFKPPYYFPRRITSKIGRKVVQENCEVMSTFHITLREYWGVCVHTDTVSAVGGWGSNHAKSPKACVLHEIYIYTFA